MSADYNAGVTVHLRNGARITPDIEAQICAAVEAIRKGERGYARYGEFLFRYGSCNGHGAFQDGTYIALGQYFIDDEAIDGPAEVLLQRDMPVIEELAAELRERLGDMFEVATCSDLD